MTNPNSAVEEQQQQAQRVQGNQPQQRSLMPCDINIFYVDKVNETIVSIDVPQNLPNGLIQIPMGDEMIVLNPQHIRRMKIKAIKQEENKIIV